LRLIIDRLCVGHGADCTPAGRQAGFRGSIPHLILFRALIVREIHFRESEMFGRVSATLSPFLESFSDLSRE
jgi:hypothetical protein